MQVGLLAVKWRLLLCCLTNSDKRNCQALPGMIMQNMALSEKSTLNSNAGHDNVEQTRQCITNQITHSRQSLHFHSDDSLLCEV